MRLNKNRLLISISIIILCLIIILTLSLLKNNKDKYMDLKDSLSNTFFYLDDNYTDMNTISDFCKISLVYDTNYLKMDNKIKGYSKNNVLNSLKKILGSNVTVDFDNLIKDKCVYNSKVTNLTYNSKDNILYTIGSDKSNRQVVVTWYYEKENKNSLELKAHALMIVKNDNYDLYIDNDNTYLIGSYNSLNVARKAAKNNMHKSYDYSFILTKEDGNYIWKEFNVFKNDEVFID